VPAVCTVVVISMWKSKKAQTAEGLAMPDRPFPTAERSKKGRFYRETLTIKENQKTREKFFCFFFCFFLLLLLHRGRRGETLETEDGGKGSGPG